MYLNLVQVCMLMSSLFHTFLCHSEATKASWQRADHAGILLALWGTYTRLIVTNFSCFPAWLTCHLAAMSLLCGLVLAVRGGGGEGEKGAGTAGGATRRVVVPLFMGVALYAVAPFAHWIVITESLAQNNVTQQASFQSMYIFDSIS
jgi:predicted membrane channel-forming protein YqfA (hemolysin III family)